MGHWWDPNVTDLPNKIWPNQEKDLINSTKIIRGWKKQTKPCFGKTDYVAKISSPYYYEKHIMFISVNIFTRMLMESESN
jgi:hypothetical protein